MVEQIDAAPTDVLVVDVRTEEDLVLGRHAIYAAHARAGALIVLDLRQLEPWSGGVARTWIDEIRRETAGNGQGLAVLGAPTGLGWDAGDGPDAVSFYPDLQACLAERAPLRGSAHALRLTLPARLEYVAPIKTHVAAVVRALHGDADAFQVEILVDELGVNAVENSPSSRNSFDFMASVENHELRLEVTNDFDEAIDSTRIMNRRLQSFDDSGGYLGERGRGLFLIARIADGLHIRAVDGDRVRVTVSKRLRQK